MIQSYFNNMLEIINDVFTKTTAGGITLYIISEETGKAAAKQTDWLSAILPLVGVFLGGILSYITTLLLKKREDKKELENRRSDNVYIPICSAAEGIKRVSYGTDTWNYGEVIADNYDDDEWCIFRGIVDKALSAASRPSLTKEDIKVLTDLKNKLDNFEKNIEEYVFHADEELNLFVTKEIAKKALSNLLSTPYAQNVVDLTLVDRSDTRKAVLIGILHKITIRDIDIEFEEADGTQYLTIVEMDDENIRTLAKLDEAELEKCPAKRYDKLAALAMKYVTSILMPLNVRRIDEIQSIFLKQNALVRKDLTEILTSVELMYSNYIARIDNISQ